MKYIKKGQEPQSFTDWKSLENDNWKPTYSDLRGQIKTDAHEFLLKEQGYTCCYCGMKIDIDISHIEHLQPQNEKDPEQPKNPALAIDFSNLLASCGFSEKYKISDPEKNMRLFCTAYSIVAAKEEIIRFQSHHYKWIALIFFDTQVLEKYAQPKILIKRKLLQKLSKH